MRKAHQGRESEDVQKSEILRGYKMQSKAVFTCVEGVIKRAIKENISLICLKAIGADLSDQL